MNRKVVLLTILSLLIMINIITPNTLAEAKDVALLISLDKQNYKADDMLHISFKLENYSKEDYWFILNHYSIVIEIKNENGEMYYIAPPEGHMHYVEGNLYLIKPQEFVTTKKSFIIRRKELVLNGEKIKYFGLLTDDLSGIIVGRKFEMKISYNINNLAIRMFDDRWNKTTNFYNEKLESNTVEFEIS